MTYVLLIYTAASGGSPSPEARARALSLHRAVQAEASSAGELHAVAQLDAPIGARTVRMRADGAHEVLDGPYIETKEWLVGFYLVDCADEEAALDRARALVGAPDHVIEVRPVAWRWEPCWEP